MTNGNGLKNGFKPENEIKLYCGTKSGSIYLYQWCHREETFAYISEIGTRIKDIRALHFMPPVCMMIMSTKQFMFMDMKDTSEMYITRPWTVDLSEPLAIYETLTRHDPTNTNGPPNSNGSPRKPAEDAMSIGRVIFCVFRENIMRIDVQRISGRAVQAGSLQEVYKAKNGAAISCCTQSEDGKYLVLGTEKGIVVFDCGQNVEWQRNSNGYRIACIDMCTCDDFNYRYLMISGTENGLPQVVNIYGLPGRKNVGRTMSNDRSAYYGHSAKLMGDNHFEVIRSNADVLIYAVETCNVVHILRSADKCVEGFGTIEGPWKKITCTGQWAGKFCFGTVDGKFYVALNRPDEGQPEYEEVSSGMRDAIVYIKGIDPNYCIVATETQYVIHSWRRPGDSILQTGKIVDCFSVDTNGRIIVVREQPPVQLVDMKAHTESKIKFLAATSGNVIIVGSEYQGDTLALLDINGKIRFFTVDQENLHIDFELAPRTRFLIQYQVSKIALSRDAGILAVGSQKGDIYVSSTNCEFELEVI